MIKYIIHLCIALILCFTSWLALWPILTSEGGIILGILGCGFSAFIEYLGYLSFRHYDRTGDKPSFAFGLLILLASGFLTWYGADLMSIIAKKNASKVVADQYTAQMDRALANDSYMLSSWQKDKDAFDTRRDDQLSSIDVREMNELMTIGNQDFRNAIKNEDSGLNWFIENRPDWIEQKNQIQAKYSQERSDLLNSTYDVEKPVSEVSILKQEMDSKAGLLVSEAEAKSTILQIADVFLVIVVLLDLWAKWVGRTEDNFFPSKPISENLAAITMTGKDFIGHLLESGTPKWESKLHTAYSEGVESMREWEQAAVNLSDRLQTAELELGRAMQSLSKVEVENESLKQSLSEVEVEVEDAKSEAEEWKSKHGKLVMAQEVAAVALSSGNGSQSEVTSSETVEPQVENNGFSYDEEVVFEDTRYKNWKSFTGSLSSLESKLKSGHWDNNPEKLGLNKAKAIRMRRRMNQLSGSTPIKKLA